MATNQLYVTVKVAWWVPWYLRGVAMTSLLTGLEPDEEKVMCWVLRGISLVHRCGPQA